MKRRYSVGRGVPRCALLCALPFVFPACQSSQVYRPAFPVLQYPETHVVDVVDIHHDTPVPDPYRWLEDPDSEATRTWIDAQNELSSRFFESIPDRDSIRDRLTELWNYERYGVPRQKNGWYFFTKNDGLQNHSALYVAESLEADPRLLLDPNLFSEDGTVSLAGWSPSPDGKLLAYAISRGGSDWREWRIRDVATGGDLDDVLEWVKFSSASWTADSKGFFYSRYQQPSRKKLQAANFHQKLYFHRVGDPQSADALVYERPEHKKWGFRGLATEDGHWLIISVRQGTARENGIYYQDLRTPDAPIRELLGKFDATYEFLGNYGSRFFFRTDLDAQKGRIIAMDVTSPERDRQWQEIVPEGADVIRSAGCVGGHLVVTYLKDAYSHVRVFDPAGTFVRVVELPGTGSAFGFGGRHDEPETFYSYTSFTEPPTIYQYHIGTGVSRPWRRPAVDFPADPYVTEQVFYTSRDGTRVPMFLIHHRDLRRDGRNPTYLYGYGGFGISITPSFSVQNLAWLERGGTVAIANLRGGGEYGKAWHDAGRLDNKQNVFDDFIAAAEWLIANGYTSTPRLAIAGRSNGGLLVGACLTQRPDLYGACLPAVGVMDMLRFEEFTIGWAWVSDYGSVEDPAAFRTLHAYSPLHNLRPGTSYPPTLVTTADHDDRVVPAHSYKFAAALQAAQEGTNPVLIRIQTKAGHGGGKSTEKRIEEAADQWAFLIRVLGMAVEE